MQAYFMTKSMHDLAKCGNATHSYYTKDKTNFTIWQQYIVPKYPTKYYIMC